MAPSMTTTSVDIVAWLNASPYGGCCEQFMLVGGARADKKKGGGGRGGGGYPALPSVAWTPPV